MTAPITSNRPTTTRLHHYAGRHSHGSGIPVETFFTPAWGASTPVEIFFAHAHPKWLIFDHFHLAGAIFLSQRHPKLPPGATQGRSFFHTAPRDDTESPPVWRVPEYPEGLAAVPVGGGGAWPRCPWVAAGPGRASRSTTPSAARVWRSRGRAAAHRHTQRPGPPAPGTPMGPQATTRENKNRRPRRICGFIVREGGVEPPLHHWNTDLNRARLPIPPLARTQKE